jgi:hypothetical protein
MKYASKCKPCGLVSTVKIDYPFSDKFYNQNKPHHDSRKVCCVMRESSPRFSPLTYLATVLVDLQLPKVEVAHEG